MQRAARGKYKKKKEEDKIGALQTLEWPQGKSPMDQLSCVLLQIAMCGLRKVLKYINT